MHAALILWPLIHVYPVFDHLQYNLSIRLSEMNFLYFRVQPFLNLLHSQWDLIHEVVPFVLFLCV